MTVLFWVIALASFATSPSLPMAFSVITNSRKVMRDRFKAPSTDTMPLIYRGEGNSFKKQFLDWVSSLGHFCRR